jgi:carbon storage regulator CsrA
MLMLTVKDGDYIMLGDDVKIRFVTAGTVYKLAVDAPKDMRIRRKGMYEAETASRDGADYAKSKKRYTYPPRKQGEPGVTGR